MSTRDRTQDFILIQSQYAVPHHTAVQVENPLWVKIMQNVRAMEVEAATELREMGVLIDERTRVGGSNRDFEAEERAVEVKHQRIVKIFARAAAEVKRLDIKNDGENLDEDLKRELTDGGTQVELKLLRNASACLAQELEALNSQVKLAKNRFVQMLDKQRMTRERVSGGTKQREVEKRLERARQLDEYAAQGVSLAQIQTIELNTRLQDEQNAEFRRILEGIKVLNEMFEDLHTMIIEQGTLLDRIDENMNQAHAQVQKGRKVLDDAAGYQNASSFTLCVLLMVVMVIGLLLALMLKMASS